MTCQNFFFLMYLSYHILIYLSILLFKFSFHVLQCRINIIASHLIKIVTFIFRFLATIVVPVTPYTLLAGFPNIKTGILFLVNFFPFFGVRIPKPFQKITINILFCRFSCFYGIFYFFI